MSERQEFYYVMNGQMMSGWKIASINVQVESYYDIFRLLGGDPSSPYISPDLIQKMGERPGEWVLMSGHRVVHGDDLYESREEAAEAYKKYLLGE